MKFTTQSTAVAIRCAFVALLLAVLPQIIHAQIVLTGKGDAGSAAVDRGIPYFSVELAATKDDAPFLLTTSNVIIIENNASTVPVEVTAPVNGFQTVRWKYTNHRIASVYIRPSFLAFDGNATAQITTSIVRADHSAPYVQFQTTFADRIRELEFGSVGSGLSLTKTIEVRAITGIKQPNGQELPVRIDSMVLVGNGFSAEWKGNFMSSQPPPNSIISPLGYAVDITFSPTDNSYHRASLFVYYDSGLYSQLILEGNKFTMPDISAIKLISPNGGERFSPCEDVTVKWQGHVNGIATLVEYSIDGGKQWKVAGQSNDSQFVWRVPAEVSNTVVLRASQRLTQSEAMKLEGPKQGAHALAFSADGTKLLAAYTNGDVIEWNVETGTQIFTYPSAGGASPIYGLGYTADGSIAVIARGTSAAETQMSIFKSNNANPVVSTELPVEFEVKSVTISPDGTGLFVVPATGAQIYVYGAADGAFQRTIDLPAPIGAIGFASGTGVLGAALLDNTIRLMRPSDFAIINTIPTAGIPITLQFSLSADNAFVAISSRLSTTTLTSPIESEINIIESSTATVVRSLRNVGSSNSVGLSFSSTARFLAIGLVGVPQIGMWNLISDSFSGNLDGHAGVLTDIQFSPMGSKLATSSVAATDNVRVRGFAFPEADASDNFLSIVPLNIAITSPTLPATYIGTAFDTVLTSAFCNNGEAPVILTGVRLANGASFQLMSPFTGDTLQPGECLSFQVKFEPRDTGRINDELIYSTCNSELTLPLQATGLNRAIGMLADKQTFSEICVGEVVEREIDFVRNNDPIPLTIDRIEVDNAATSPFTILTPVNNLVLQPGEILRVLVRFAPTVRGDDNRVFRVYHSGQSVVIAAQTILGRGLGAEITLQSTELRFIPEQLSRTLVMNNPSSINVTIDSVKIVPEGAFTVTTQLPLVIPAGGQVSIDVEWNLTPATADASLSTFFTPCAVAQTATIGLYKASSILSMPVVEADPRGNASIPVRFKTLENRPYNGKRVFEAQFTVNAGLFLPTSITSEYGTATISRNDIVAGKRIIGVRVEGEFPTEGVVAVVSGPAGLAEVTTSTLEFAANPKPWGDAVQVMYESGDFRLIGVCGDRRLLPSGAVAVVAVYPNPAHDAVTVELNAPTGGTYTVSIVDALGTVVMAPLSQTAVEGRNSVQLVLPPVADGNYRLIVQQGTSVTSAALTVRNQ